MMLGGPARRPFMRAAGNERSAPGRPVGNGSRAAAAGFAGVAIAVAATAVLSSREQAVGARQPAEQVEVGHMGAEGSAEPQSPAVVLSSPLRSQDFPLRSQDFRNLPYDGAYTFVRVRFNVGGRGGFGRGFGRGPPWAHDFPYADNNFAKLLDEVTLVGPHTDGTNVVSADSPELHRFPIAYVSEPGHWRPTRAEIDNMAAYLAKGGFLILDDFRGSREWLNVENVFAAVLPGHRFRQLDLDEPVFDSFFQIETLDFSPPTFRQYKPYFLGIHQENDPAERLLVVANFNNDIGDYWEYSDTGWFPVDLSNEAYKVGINYVIYALTR